VIDTKVGREISLTSEGIFQFGPYIVQKINEYNARFMNLNGSHLK
jgi:hypothetical protein